MQMLHDYMFNRWMIRAWAHSLFEILFVAMAIMQARDIEEGVIFGGLIISNALMIAVCGGRPWLHWLRKSKEKKPD